MSKEVSVTQRFRRSGLPIRPRFPQPRAGCHTSGDQERHEKRRGGGEKRGSPEEMAAPEQTREPARGQSRAHPQARRLRRTRWGRAATWREMGVLQPRASAVPGTLRIPTGSFTFRALPRSLTAAALPRKWAWRRPLFLARGHSSSGSPRGGPPSAPGRSAGSCPPAGNPGCCGSGRSAGH